jgi:soluble lytic murein transglycosylase-like protein
MTGVRPLQTIRAREAGADPYGAHDNIIAGAGYLRELHDCYPISRFLAAYDGVRRGPPRTA